MADESSEQFAEWVILELMGHRRLAGYLSEVEIAGAGYLRLDVYPGDAKAASMTQFYRPGSVYCITPTTEALARSVAKSSDPAPVSRFELTVGQPDDPYVGHGGF